MAEKNQKDQSIKNLLISWELKKKSKDVLNFLALEDMLKKS